MKQALPQTPHRAGRDALSPSIDSPEIRCCGEIQGFGALLILQRDSLDVIGASENLGNILGVSAAFALGMSLQKIDPDIASELAQLTPREADGLHVMASTLEVDGQSYDVLTHRQGAHRFVEFLPNRTPSTAHLRNVMHRTNEFTRRIAEAADFGTACRKATDGIRQITGFDRVALYQIKADRVDVIVESGHEGAQHALDDRVPAMAIPQMTDPSWIGRPRHAVCGAHGSTVAVIVRSADIHECAAGHAVLAATSRSEEATLQELGLGAVYAHALSHSGRNWGAVVCYAAASQFLPTDIWTCVSHLTAALTSYRDLDREKAAARTLKCCADIETEIGKTLRESLDPGTAIDAALPLLQDGLSAHGIALVQKNKVSAHGLTPPLETIRRIADWHAGSDTPKEQYASSSFHRVLKDTSPQSGSCPGVLIQPMELASPSRVIWFRRSQPQRRARFLPENQRHGLLHTIEHLQEESLPWSDAQRALAEHVIDGDTAVTRWLTTLLRETESLREFAHTAAHDIRAPLRGIKLALDWMAEDGFSAGTLMDHHALATMSATKLQDLTDALVDFTLLDTQRFDFVATDLNDVLADVEALVGATLRETSTRLHVADLPRVRGDGAMLTRLFLNLVVNGIKYAQDDVPPVIRVGCSSGTPLRITVTDNGRGIAAEDAEVIFEPSKRLVHHNDVSGSGLGLTISRRIADKHGGRIWLDADHTPGACFVIELPEAAKRETCAQ